MKLNDPQIRVKLKEILGKVFEETSPTIADEVGLDHGNCRVDVILSNQNFLYGWEIKSDVDNLKRLPRQTRAYSQVLDFCSVVTTRRHLEEVAELVPQWWGLYLVEVSPFSDKIAISCKRIPKQNPGISDRALVRLLWRDDCWELLQSRKVDKGMKSKTKPQMVEKILQICKLDEIRAFVRVKVKEHAALGPGWKLLNKKRKERREAFLKKLELARNGRVDKPAVSDCTG